MKKLLIALVALMIPAVVFAGNPNPALYLEVYGFEEEPDPVPDYVCVHATRPSEGLPCFIARLPYMFYYIPLHVGKLCEPICPTTGPDCGPYGGYLGVGFGIQQTAVNPLTFMSFNACPGFLKGPSSAGEPAACLASSFSGCHNWMDHEGYLIYINMGTKTTQANFDIVVSADLLTYDVINCASTYDEGTTICAGIPNCGGVQIGGTQVIICGDDPTGVETTTWGKIKGLYR